MSGSIFGSLDKRARTKSFGQPVSAPEFSFEDREDLLNDLLEDDKTEFPLLSCPAEVLDNILLLLPIEGTVRMRAVCHREHRAVDESEALWCALIVRDFADLGGVTKHYRGLRMTKEAWNNSGAVRRLEWDPIMICAPPALRYALLAAAVARERLWEDQCPSLGTGWSWFSSKICRRMAASTFLRWAAAQHGESNVRRLLASQPEGCQPAPATSSTPASKAATSGEQAGACSQHGAPADTQSSCKDVDPCAPAMRFRAGRSDAVTLSQAAVEDIYNTVQQWHGAAHREAMRAHIRGADTNEAASGTSPSNITTSGTPGGFSVTPTLDMVEAVAIAVAESTADLASATTPSDGAQGSAPGAASRRLEEAQLRLALDMSRAENAEAVSRGVSGELDAPVQAKASAPVVEPEPKPVEPEGLVLKSESGAAPVVVHLKDHCLAERVDKLPERFHRSVEHIVGKMVRSCWGLLYESVTEEIAFRAKSVAHVLSVARTQCGDDDDSGRLLSLEQERMSLPIWRSCADVMSGMSQLRQSACSETLRTARRGLIRAAVLEWCELEDYTEFLEEHLSGLEVAIDSERGLHDAGGHAHTPHVRDIGRLMFRNFCLLDSRIFRPLCVAAYALVHEIHAAKSAGEADEMIEQLESLHLMLSTCDVADDHLSASGDTKELFAENLVVPMTVAIERFRPWDIRGADDDRDNGRRSRTGRLRKTAERRGCFG
eukprot:TRINITY_DN55047_c0_g1_i1.p1 TRINITY_DN55047_c0_g1~~TRINITY_DN55047_c0_g1_i1.p1  ORF type:complete len:717 (-),score=81.63 TRINITY_DN55047_c0_g1_i1:153-2303(-)